MKCMKFKLIFVVFWVFTSGSRAITVDTFNWRPVFGSEQDRITYQQWWCDYTFRQYTMAVDAAEALEAYAINRDRAEEYIVNVALAEGFHAELARYCFYPAQ